MLYRLLAEATMVAHFAFLGYLALGGFLAWRWPRTIWFHLGAAGWGIVSVVTGAECPLTLAEHWGRVHAGQPGLPPSGFVDHYIEGVVYPEEYSLLVRWTLAVLVLFSYAGYLVLRRR
ncbi:DUF2784 domain-containing protein [Nonomuraea longicatena]|uniref:DUF2784 domain-containing protein n=1 Tax=Nonomuraea longicatena TaxID=83682 RepID=A0ABN1P8I0_9ACTN